jgi:hypothetical protein
MFPKKIIALLSVFLIVFASACSLSGETGVPNPVNTDLVASLAALQTEVAVMETSTFSAQPSIADTLPATQPALPSATSELPPPASLTPTPTLTFTASFTPSQTPSSTASIPLVSVSVQTNCRSGPGAEYDLLGVLPVGQTAQVLGQDPNSGYWIIRLPSNPAIICWLWGQHSTVLGNTAGLPVYAPPPTPTLKVTATPTVTSTPQASFVVIYSSTTECSGAYLIKFRITNNGNKTWESNRIIVTDQTTGETQTIARDEFPLYNGCDRASYDINLDPGEVGISTSAGLSANPAGDSLTATIRVCSKDGMAGTCQEKTITFTP